MRGKSSLILSIIYNLLNFFATETKIASTNYNSEKYLWNIVAQLISRGKEKLMLFN